MQKSKIKSQKYNAKVKSFTFKRIFEFLVVILIFDFCILHSPAAYAAGQSLRVSPVIINVGLSPNKSYTHEVTIENLTELPMPLKASFNDFITTGEEGGYVFQDTQTNPLLTWSKLSETDFILKPKEKKQLQLTIHTPTSIPLGGYYGVLFFEPVLQNAQPVTTTINSKVGILMLANIGVPDTHAQKAEIETFTTDHFSSDGNLPLVLRVKNISLNFFTAKPILTFTPLLTFQGESAVKKITLDDKIIFPGLIRRWEEDPVVEHLAPNLYAVSMHVSTGDGHYISASTHLLVFPLFQALQLIALLGVIVFLIAKRKRLRKALVALIK